MIASSNSHFDYLILGAGMSALTVGSLLAKAGFRVGMLEKHKTAGGYAHTFALGGYHFSAQVHYVWGCAPGETIYQFLEKVGLERTITFEKFDATGYDHAVLPDGTRVPFPYGLKGIADNIDSIYPGERQKVERFFDIIQKLYTELSHLPYRVHWWHYLTHGLRSPMLRRYHNKTLQNLFDECELRKEVQAILCCQCGDMGAPPETLSVMPYAVLFMGYNKGAYYPTKHFRFMTETIAESITKHAGCEIFYSTEVTSILSTKEKIIGVETKSGQKFTANNYICNIDPQQTAKKIGLSHFSKKQREALSYDYSPSAFIIYLGLKDINLRDYGFGAMNIWQLKDWDMNAIWKQEMNGNFEKPWLFISSPSLRTPDTSSTPPGCASLEIGTLTGYDYFRELSQRSHEEYKAVKQRIADQFIDSVSRDFIPNLRDHIDQMAVGTPLTNESFVGAPYGNCYGSNMSPKNMGLSRLKADTPWPNFYWCNASSGYAGIFGTIMTGLYLYEELTGDKVISK